MTPRAKTSAPTVEVPTPRENAHLVGHAQAVHQFLREFKRGRMHHAYLLCGAKGIGKATLAYHLARYVLRQGALASTPIEAPILSLFAEEQHVPQKKLDSSDTFFLTADDPIFRRIAVGSHSDLLTLVPEFDAKKNVEKSHITVEQARKVIEFLSLTPAEGEWRVVIVDAVDQLNEQAANALLKILEEPPPRAMLLLVCHRPEGILPTIRSRCRRMPLMPPTREEFLQIFEKFTPTLAAQDFTALYAMAQGSPGLALTLAREHGLRWYEGWLTAMQPEVGAETRLQFVDSLVAIKSPDTWEMALYAWRLVMARLTLHPYPQGLQLFAREGVMLATLAERTPSDLRLRWQKSGEKLLRATETFHLDKRQTIRLLLAPQPLELVF